MISCMEPIPTDLARAALDARERLTGFARNTAANTVPGSAGGTMAAAAKAAIFSDALLAAMHARLQELKSIAK
jgi:hypothetical protein